VRIGEEKNGVFAVFEMEGQRGSINLLVVASLDLVRICRSEQFNTVIPYFRRAKPLTLQAEGLHAALKNLKLKWKLCSPVRSAEIPTRKHAFP
jgi:hypothetical protein